MSYTAMATQYGNGGRTNGTVVSAEKTSRIVSRAKFRASSSAPPPLRNGDAENFPIIVHCHLCWDWVWQRPQQFLSRLSARHKILFVETVGPDPQLAAPYARFRNTDGF